MRMMIHGHEMETTTTIVAVKAEKREGVASRSFLAWHHKERRRESQFKGHRVWHYNIFTRLSLSSSPTCHRFEWKGHEGGRERRPKDAKELCSGCSIRYSIIIKWGKCGGCLNMCEDYSISITRRGRIKEIRAGEGDGQSDNRTLSRLERLDRRRFERPSCESPATFA